MGLNLFDPDVLKVVLPYLILTGAIGVVVAGLIVWQLTKVQSQQNATQKMLIDFMQKDLSNIRNDFVAAGRSQTIELQEQTKVLAAMREDRRGDLALSVKLVEAVQGTGEDMTSALSAYTKKTMEALDAGRARMIEAVKEVTSKQDLKEAVQFSIDNQNKNHGVVTTKLDAIDKNVSAQIAIGQVLDRVVENSHQLVLIADRFANAQGLVAEFRDAISPRVSSLETEVQRLVEVVQELKSGTPRPNLDKVAAALTKRDSKPIPPMPPLDTPIGDISQPPSLVITHAEESKPPEVTQ